MFALWNALVLGLWQVQAYPIKEVFHQDYKYAKCEPCFRQAIDVHKLENA